MAVLSPNQAKTGNLLKIKPLLYVDNHGDVQSLGKIRTDKKINRRLAKVAEEAVEDYPNGVMLGFVYAVDQERMAAAIQELTKARARYYI